MCFERIGKFVSIPHYEMQLWKWRAWSAKNKNDAYEKIEEIPRERWILAYDGGRRYGHMTTILVECINGVLKKTRHLPITALVEATYYKLVTTFARRLYQAAKAVGNNHEYSKDCNKHLRAAERRARRLDVTITFWQHPWNCCGRGRGS